MKLLATNKIATPHILCNKFILAILLFFHVLVHTLNVASELTCHHCDGINCLRSSHEATQKCVNQLDICVNIFDGQTLLAQGCWEQLAPALRSKCSDSEKLSNTNELSECFKCSENLCNTLSSNLFECIQCDSDSDANCRTNPISLQPSRCDIPRTLNSYCFVKREGERVTRGCSNTLEEQSFCLNSASCTICQPSELRGCNNIELTTNNSASSGDKDENVEVENYGANRNKRTCHHCTGINCLRTSYTTIEKCINDLDICVTAFEGQTILAQGCWEQLPERVREKCDSDKNCLKCNENLCNKLGSRSFDCIQCDSDIDENCRSSPLGLLASRCGASKTINEYCFAKKEGDHITRGCSYTLEEQKSCLSSVDCMICQPIELFGCNNIKVINYGENGDAVSGNGDSEEENTGSTGSENDLSGNGSEGSGSIVDNTPTGEPGSGVGSESGSGGTEPDNNNHEGTVEPGTSGCGISILSPTISTSVIAAFLFYQLK